MKFLSFKRFKTQYRPKSIQQDFPNCPLSHLWTVTSCEEGDWIIQSGLHRSDVIGYIYTQVPRIGAEEIQVDYENNT